MGALRPAESGQPLTHASRGGQSRCRTPGHLNPVEEITGRGSICGCPGCSRVRSGRGAPGWVISTSGISGKPVSRRGPRLPGTGQMTAVPPAPHPPAPALPDSDSPSQPPRGRGDGAGIQSRGLCLAWGPPPGGLSVGGAGGASELFEFLCEVCVHATP